ncbi:DUF4097 family beta strand repeat-containing protein [Fodinicola acaciae]|uniref:DUF4097 family beta strand repeat-containing protein n=1 Tax=Fodinicola acaciae TaxID=2681555 RepID=UPI0013D44159|nr:DUF4097 family beta strand repeat-containing protein [Fodinicola acaciae]
MHEFETPRPVRVQVRIAAGEVTMTSADVTTTTVDIQPYPAGDDRAVEAIARTTVEQRGDTIVVYSPERGGFMRRTPRLHVTIIAPLRSSLENRVGSADLHTYGPLSDIRHRSGSGNTTIEHATGDITIDCASGDTRIERVDGRLRHNSASGELLVGTANGLLTANSASGNIRIDSLRGPAKVINASGDVTVERAYEGDVYLQALSGDITAGVPAGVRFYIDANALSGRAESDLPVSDHADGGGRPPLTLRLRAFSGNIRVVRAPGEKTFAESTAGSPTEVRLEK